MKKVLTIIISLLCVLCVSASPIHVSASMNYSSTYKGSGRNGMIYTTSSARMVSIGGGGSMAQAPTASMGSTTSSRGIGMTTTAITTAPQVSGIYTSASAIRGGVTTYSPRQSRAPRREPGHGGNAEGLPGCGCDWHDNGDGTYTCPICGCTWDEYDDAGEESCHCEAESGYCWCPLDFNWAVSLFMAILAGVYATYKARARKKVC